MQEILFGDEVLEFPNDMTDDEIRGIMQGLEGTPEPKVQPKTTDIDVFGDLPYAMGPDPVRDPSKPRETIGRLAQQAIRAPGVGVSDMLEFLRASELQGDPATEEYDPGKPYDPQEAHHMVEWTRLQEGKVDPEARRQEVLKYRTQAQKDRVMRLEKAIKYIPDFKPGSSGIIEELIKSAGRFVVNMGISWANPLVGTLTTFAQLTGVKYEELIQKGVDRDRAYDAAVLSGLLQTPLEMAGNLIQIGVLKNFAKTLGVKSSGRMLTFAEGLAKSAAGEGVEEFLQAYPDEIATIYAENAGKSNREIAQIIVDNLWDITKGGMSQAAMGALAGLFLAGFGGAVVEGVGAVKSKHSDQIKAPASPIFADMAAEKGSSITEEGIRYGMKASPETIEKMKAERAEINQQTEKMRAEAKKLGNTPEAKELLEHSIELGQQSQGLREGIEANEGTHMSRREGELKEYAPPTVPDGTKALKLKTGEVFFKELPMHSDISDAYGYRWGNDYDKVESTGRIVDGKYMTENDFMDKMGKQVVQPMEAKPVDQVEFVQARNKSSRPEQFAVGDMPGFTFYKIPGKDAGFAINHKTGQRANLFNNTEEQGLGAVLSVDSVSRGGKKLSAYDGKLPKLYRSLGFKETSRKPFDEDKIPEGTKWDFEKMGRPDVVEMEFDENYDIEEIKENYKRIWGKELGTGSVGGHLLPEIEERFKALAKQRDPGIGGFQGKTYGEAINTAKGSKHNVLVSDTKQAPQDRIILGHLSDEVAGMPDQAKDYGDAIYSSRLDRPADFWEIPPGLAELKYSVKNADTLVIRNAQQAIDYLNEVKPKAITFSAMDVNKSIVKEIAEGYPGKIVVGGYVNKDFFKDNPNIHFVDSIKEGVEALGFPYKKGMDYRHFKGTKTTPRLCLSSGCLHKCAFCTIPKGVKEMPKSQIDDHVKSFKGLDFRHIYIDDKTYGQGKNHQYLKHLFKKTKKQNPKFEGFIVQTTATQATKFTPEFLKESGIKYVELGVESYNDNIQELLNKPHRTKHVNAAVQHLSENGIQIIPNILVGSAGVKDGKLWTETKESYQNTLDWLKANKDKFSHVNVYNLTPFEGTKTGEQLKEAVGKDINENVVERSYLRNPEIHKDFYEKVQALGEEMLTKKPPEPVVDYKGFEDSETERRYKESQRKVGPTAGGIIAGKLTEIKNLFTRQFKHLPRGEFTQLQFDLNKLSKQRGIQTDIVTRTLYTNVLKDLKGPNRDLFERQVYLKDLAQVAKRGHDLPHNFTQESLAREISRLDSKTAGNKEVNRAIEARRILWDSVKKRYTKAMADAGHDVKDMLSWEDYYRHIIIDYAQAKGLARMGTGQKLETPLGRSWQKKRTGKGGKDYITNYAMAETEVLTQMYYDIQVAETLKSVDDEYNKYDELVERAKGINTLKEIEGTEDPDVTWRDLISEDHSLFQADRGNHLYLADTVQARLAKEILKEDMAALVSPEELSKTLAMGAKKRQMVLPDPVVATLYDLTDPGPRNQVAQANRKLIKLWKAWKLGSPWTTVKYQTRNVTGDAEPVFIGNSKAFAHVPAAIAELGQVFGTKKPLTGDLKDWVEMGGVAGSQQAQELEQVKDYQIIKGIMSKEGIKKATDIPAAVWKRYWKTIRLSNDYRESTLRYANYKEYMRQMRKNPDGMPDNFGASLPKEIKALKDMKERAYWLSNDLLGAYDRVSQFTSGVSDTLYPFARWKEVNLLRYIRLAKNASNDKTLTSTIGKKLIGTVAATPYHALRVGKFVLMASAFTAGLNAWNMAMHPDEEKDLPKHVKNTPHITFDSDEVGDLQYFTRVGATGDLLEWFGLDAAPYYMKEYKEGKMTLKEIAKDMAKSPANVIVSGGVPYVKFGAELLTRRSLFPDIFDPGTVRDRMFHAAKFLNIENEYLALSGKPSRPYLQSLNKLYIYKIDPLEAAYRDTLDSRNKFLQKIGKFSEGFWLTPKGNALYNARMAMRYQDEKAAVDYMGRYVELGGTMGGLKRAVSLMHPLSGLSKLEQAAWAEYMSQEDKEKLTKAMRFYEELATVQ